MSKVGRHITSLVLAAYIASHVSDQAYAQNLCDLGAQVVELLSTIDACAATGEQLAELEDVRQQIIAPYAEIDCGELQERISELELTMPRRRAEWPTTLDQPVPMCEATQRTPASRSAELVKTTHE